MNIPFYKYQGTGNDFIIIDNREAIFPKKEAFIERLCHRRFGIGADGLILLESHPSYDFEMVYYNADGRISSMCGNGGRCIAAFAKKLGIIDKVCRFLAIDGPHEAVVEAADWVELKMRDVTFGERGQDYVVLDTGSPHYIVFVEDLDDINIVENGKAIRYSAPYKKEGINVNFVEQTANAIEVATYERGVEDETYSCGTGVTAAAIAYYMNQPEEERTKVAVKTKGGDLEVRFLSDGKEGVKEVWLCGKANLVFAGELESRGFIFSSVRTGNITS